MSYYNRIKQENGGAIRVEGSLYPRKSIRYYREDKNPNKGKPKLPVREEELKDVFIDVVVAKPQLSKRAKLSAEDKVKFDKILNSQVSNFIFKNFPWDKTKKPREYWIEQDVWEDDVMLTGFESFNSWYKVYKPSDANRSSAKGGTGFWMLAINKLMSGGYHDQQFMPGLHLTELLRKIEEQYDE
jgi:hypothetical protein